METRHRRELAKRDKEFVALQLDLEHQKSARIALQSQHKYELRAQAKKHQQNLVELEMIAEKQLNDKWHAREQQERLKLEQELAN